MRSRPISLPMFHRRAFRFPRRMMPLPSIAWLFAVVAVVAPGIGHAQDDRVDVRVDWLDGRSEYGKLQFLAETRVGIVPRNSDSGEVVTAATSELVRIRWRNGSGLSTGDHPMQMLRDGSRFRAQLRKLTDTEARFMARWYGRRGAREQDRESLPVPIEQVRFLHLQTPGTKAAIDDDAVQRLIDEETPEDDAVIMTHGARVAVIRCIVLGVSSRQVKLWWKDKEYTLDRDRVWGLRLAALPDSEPQADGTGYVRIGSRRDERIYGVSFLCQPGTREFMVNRPGDVRWTVAEAYVADVVYASERSVDLTSLQPASVESETLLGRSWPVRVGTSVRGQPLRIGHHEFADGIGCHAPARITYDLPPGFERLVVTVGVDPAAADAGSVVFRVLDGAGNELAASPLMTAGASSKRLVVDLGGVRRIVLVADPAIRLDVGDHANWCDPRLIRAE